MNMDTPLSHSLSQAILNHLESNNPISTLSEKPTITQLSSLVASLTNKDPRIKPHPLFATLSSALSSSLQIQSSCQNIISNATSSAHLLKEIELMLLEYKAGGVVIEEAEVLAGMVERTKKVYEEGGEGAELRLVEMEAKKKAEWGNKKIKIEE